MGIGVKFHERKKLPCSLCWVLCVPHVHDALADYAGNMCQNDCVCKDTGCSHARPTFVPSACTCCAAYTLWSYLLHMHAVLLTRVDPVCWTCCCANSPAATANMVLAALSVLLLQTFAVLAVLLLYKLAVLTTSLHPQCCWPSCCMCRADDPATPMTLTYPAALASLCWLSGHPCNHCFKCQAAVVMLC